MTTPSLPGRCVWDHCPAERPSHVSSSMPLLMEGDFQPKSHNTWPHSFFPLHGSVVLVPLQKNSPKVWCSLDATQHSLSSKHNELSFYQKVLLWFNLTI
uniref:Uncharacterized protein n=1 Tax=Leptobrachium leishanense TaxID=445787 RepID=A0A8C5PZW1_9ANUR